MADDSSQKSGLEAGSVDGDNPPPKAPSTAHGFQQRAFAGHAFAGNTFAISESIAQEAPPQTITGQFHATDGADSFQAKIQVRPSRDQLIADLVSRVEFLETIVRAARGVSQPPAGPGHNRPPLFPGVPELDDDIDGLIECLRSQPTAGPSAINDRIKEAPEQVSKLRAKVAEYADEAGKSYAKGIGSGGAALTYAAIGYALHQVWIALRPFLALLP